MDYFEALLALLTLEKEEDLRAYTQQAGSTSITDRRAAGTAWYPVAIRGTEITRGDYLVVELERPSHREINHQLRSGALAVLFSNNDRWEDRLEGVIGYSSTDRLKITLKTDELPEWSHHGKLGVELLFDSNSYHEMQGALKKASREAGTNRLIQILTGASMPREDALGETSYIPLMSLNSEQNLAVQKILAAPELAIVHGPPGTGKTTTLVEAILAIIREDQRPVLAVAPSNAAVDLLTEKLDEKGLNVIRIGNPVRVSDHLAALTLDAKLAAHPAAKDLRDLKKRAAEFRSMANRYKRNFGRAEQDQRSALFAEVRQLLKEADRQEDYILDALLGKAQVITATLLGANYSVIRSLDFHTVVIDEAAQALEPACWIPILKARKLILAGDPYQLAPTIKSLEAARKGLPKTLMEKNLILHPGSVILLEEQYRMNEAIMAYPSAVFYLGRLRANGAVKEHVLFSGDTPFLFIDTAGCSFTERSEGTSTVNEDEALFLLTRLDEFLGELGQIVHGSETIFPSIAVISPYKEQINLLLKNLPDFLTLVKHRDKIAVNTIDSFQGQERDIVYISLVRSNNKQELGFLSDIRRTNVAMTRARKKLVMIGDSSTLAANPFYAGLIRYAEKRNAWQSAWGYLGCVLLTFILSLYSRSNGVWAQERFNGLDMNLSTLSRLSDAKTRSISPENFSGEKGKGAMADPSVKNAPNQANAADAASELGQGWKVNPFIEVKSGQTFTIAEIDGSGAIQHIWMTPTGNWRFSILRFYWDGEREPSIEVPVGDFYCMGLGEYAPVRSLPVVVNPGSAFNCYWKMPFRKHCRVTLSNIDPAKSMRLYYQIDYVLTSVPSDEAYLHAQFRRINPNLTSVFILLDHVKGRGQYVGTYIAWGPKNNGWWGEGEIKFYLDGDTRFPTINGTGTEDYFCGSYNFENQATHRYEPFTSLYSGLIQAISPDGVYRSQSYFGLYRWHISDPLRFEKDLRVTIQDLGWRTGGHYLKQRSDIASVAFWYQQEPHASFPSLPSREELELIH